MSEAVPVPTADKLAAARTRLILDKPFLGALVLRLPLKRGRRLVPHHGDRCAHALLQPAVDQ